VTDKEPRNENKLKAVAGLLQSLSYREMQKFVRMMTNGSNADDFATRLLDVTDQILNEKE
jgi:sensor histidine kinase regulating citrate/malate metabolism